MSLRDDVSRIGPGQGEDARKCGWRGVRPDKGRNE